MTIPNLKLDNSEIAPSHYCHTEYLVDSKNIKEHSRCIEL